MQEVTMSVAEASKANINDETAPARRVRDVRSFQRYAAAVIMLVPATCVAIGRLFQTDDSDTRRTLDLIAANPDRQFTFALLGFIGLVTVVPASWRPPASRGVGGRCLPPSRSRSTFWLTSVPLR
jgi:hypothetical protein